MALVHRSLAFSSSALAGPSNALSIRHPPPAPPAPTDLPALQAASQVLLDKLNKDAHIIPDLGDMLASPGVQTSASYSVFPDDDRVPFQKRRLAGIPEGLFQYYNTTNVTSHMGLIPEVERAWITIDHQLFLWDYVQGENIMTYNEQPDNIIHVAIVKPKPGIFVETINHVLVICTPITVLLIGVESAPALLPNNRPHKDIQLYATEMSVTTEVEMTSVAALDDGRIFLGSAQDNNLYELHYQDKEGWFGKRIQIINHSVGGVQSLFPKFSSNSSEEHTLLLVADPARGIFYTLSSRNIISIYRPNGDKSVQLIQTLSNLYKAAQDRAPGAPALTPKNFQIIALHVVEPNESRSGVQLIAVTSTGVRLYFSSASTGYYSYGGMGGGPTGARQLQLAHVRLPPPNLLHPDEQSAPYRPGMTAGYSAGQPPTPTSRPFIVSGLESSCYLAGLTIAAQKGDTDGTDFLLCMAPDLTRIGSLGQVHPPAQQQQLAITQNTYSNPYGAAPPRPPLTEYAALIAVPGNTWAMAPVPATFAAGSPNVPAPGVSNELALQFSETTRQFMVLTNAGLTFLARRRPLDYLRDVLEEVHVDGNVQSIIDFRDSFGREQTCAMLIGLASGNTFLETGDLQATGTLASISPDLAAVAKQAFYDFGERPLWTERMTYGTGDGSGTAVFSGRREGFALYFARLVRPIWKAKLTQPGPAGQHLGVDESLLVIIQKNLFALKEFLDKNPQLFHSAPGEQPGGARSAAASEQDAWRVEQESVSALATLLARTIEAISFVLLLNDYHLGELITKCPPDIQTIVTGLTFEDLITAPNGVTASRALVNVVIDQQIGQQIGVDTISDVLQHRCGSFCSTDDVMLYKAKENVRRAVETNNPAERQNLLGESLRLFIKGARIVEYTKLQEIVGDYQQLNYAKGAVELPMYCAEVADSQGQGRDYWHAGCPINDSRMESWERRRRCYDLVLDSLGVFEGKAAAAANGQPVVDDPEAVRAHAYELAFLSEDEMFHSTLYDWLIGKGLADELLEMRPVYLEAHLRREPVSVQKFQLLWQFYVKDGQPLRAAEVLAVLAESQDFDLPLDSRLECLTLAVGNAKSHPVSAGGRHETAIAFLTDLEEKLEVAQVQLEIYNTLLPHINDGGEITERITALSQRLMNISDLYQEYAEPFDLPTVKLLVLHVSQHRDDSLSRSVWNQIFESVLEDAEGESAADRIVSKTVPLGLRFYPSESAFPLRHIASLLVRFALANKGVVPYGWAPRILVQCGVPYAEIWDLFHEMYESQIPPFNEQSNVQTISSDIAVLLSDWLEEARRPMSPMLDRDEFPVSRIDLAIDQYLAELEPARTQTRTAYEAIKRQLRRNW